MAVEKKSILMVGKDGKGGLVHHPAQFPYPEKKKVAERWFFNTYRTRDINGETVAVFTEEGFTLNLDDFADPATEGQLVEQAKADAKPLEELIAIIGEDSLFEDMLIDWHNNYLNRRVDK